MALDRKSVHVRLSEEQHHQLIILAEVFEKDIAELAALYLEKIIIGEFHVIKRSAEKMKALGMIRE